MKIRNCKKHKRLNWCRKEGKFTHQQNGKKCNFCDAKAVFLCYEENRHQLVNECGAINELKVFCSKVSAVKWAAERVKKATDNGYIIDTEYGDVIPDKLFKELDEDRCIDITMFNGYQENWDVSYDIIVQKLEVDE